jgi:hypothetical protein
MRGSLLMFNNVRWISRGCVLNKVVWFIEEKEYYPQIV